MSIRSIGGWLRRRAENIAAGLLAVMFVAFLIQIVFRYFFNFPIGWTSELSVITWLWLVLWGRVMGIIAGLAIVILYAASIPATVKYVSFMKVEKTSYLKIPFDWLFSIYVLFLVAVIVRYLWLLSHLLRGKDPEARDLTKVSSGL